MLLPTLLEPGNLQGHTTDNTPINVIIDFIRSKMPEFGGAIPQNANDRVIIVRSETGSGKSTVLPAYIFRLLRSEKSRSQLRRGGVICTQPRVLTAQTLARDQSADNKNYPDLVLGETLGYQTGEVNEKPTNGLIYATAGSLVAQLMVETDAHIMNLYRFIIIDEAHERSLEIDALLMTLKLFLKRNWGNSRLPFIILASATLIIHKYVTYFDINQSNIFEVTGRAYHVTTHWPTIESANYIQSAAKTIQTIHETNLSDDPTQSDILVFFPGVREINELITALTLINHAYRSPEATIRPFLLLELTGEIVRSGGRDYRMLKVPLHKTALPSTEGTYLTPMRRVIISTIVAETGITIDTLKYVIDSGWARYQETYYPGRVQGLITKPAPKSRILQRKGRVGRVAPGHFYPLYTESIFMALPSDQPPAIVVEGISPIFLSVVCAVADNGIFNLNNIDMIDPPPVDALAAALEQCIIFGYLRPALPAGHEITMLGTIASKFHTLQMHHIQILLTGYSHNISIRDLALIVSLVDQRDVHISDNPINALLAGLPVCVQPKLDQNKNEACDRLRQAIADDFIELLIIFDGFMLAQAQAEGDIDQILDWCQSHNVIFENILMVAQQREIVITELINAGLNPFWGEVNRLAYSNTTTLFFDIIKHLKQCLYSGLRFNILKRHNNTYYTNNRVIRVNSQYENASELMTNMIRITPQKKGNYTLCAGLVSQITNYVNYDKTDLDPRGSI